LTIPPTPNHLIIPGATTTAGGVQSFKVSRQLEVDLKLILTKDEPDDMTEEDYMKFGETDDNTTDN
jgi:hypothetical protein